MKPHSPHEPQQHREPKLPRPLPAVFQVVVTCKDERDQEQVYRRMQAEGRKCRVLTL